MELCEHALSVSGRLYQCKYPKWENDKEFCIFHSRSVKEKAEMFWGIFEECLKYGLFLEPISSSKESLNMMGFIFPKVLKDKYAYLNTKEGLSLIGKGFESFEFNDDVNFSHSTFYYDISFENCKFKGASCFDQCDFQGEAIFSEALFFDKASFISSKFISPKHAKFIQTKFYKQSRFSYAYFSNRADFFGASFVGDTDFWGVQFKNAAVFAMSKFYQYSSFSEAQFRLNSEFDNVLFLGAVSFEGAVFENGLNLRKSRFCSKTNFSNCKFEYSLILDESVFENKVVFIGSEINHSLYMFITQFSSIADFRKCVFRCLVSDMELEKVDLRGSDLTGSRIINPIYKIKSNTQNYSDVNIDLCQCSPSLKKYINDQKYIEELKESKYGRVPSGKIVFWIWYLFADCGRSFARWLLWSVLFAITYGLIYYFNRDAYFYVSNEGLGAYRDDFLTYQYYSIVTFTTLGFGDVIPKSIEASIWVMSEVIIGYLMLGGLITILANKLIVRS